ncbi:MAG TPA: HAMP domain-containing sensor histidine kinase [Vicinamibacteria bacterium]|nr:HAMP domain-containing sensor histidine kinase [Vicinamibacteria bacterium]
MVGWVRHHAVWIALSVLTALLAVLAVLQYTWTGEIGRGEAERRQVQLERSASRFAAGLDHELAQPLMALRLDPGPAGEARRRSLLARLADWQRRPERVPFVTGAWLASRLDSGETTLESCSLDGSGCRPAQWTGGLGALRQRLQEAPEGVGREGLPFRPALLLEDPLAEAVALFELAEDAGPVSRWRRLNGFVVLQLDAAYLREKLLPQLAETSFGPTADSAFAVAVVRRADGGVVWASDANARSAAGHPDVRVGVPFGPRPSAPEERREWGGRFGARLEPPREPPREGPADRPRGPREEAPWLLVARHHGGSIEAAVAAVRRRNLAVGLLVLGLLGLSAAVLARAAQRARALARQQLEFVAGVTHELNTPLAGIRSAGQNLADGIVTDLAQVRRYGTLIEKESRRLAAIVAQVLDFAGIESGGRVYAAEPVSLGCVVDEVLAEMKLVLEQSGLAVDRRIPADLPEVRGDAAALRRVVANLLANAAKFAASGGRVTVRAALQPDGAGVELRVEDEGPGIPPQERARVFEPFYRGSAAQRNHSPGSGLGLSLVRRVVLAHGGRVRAEEAVSGGTAMVVELPRAPVQEPAR